MPPAPTLSSVSPSYGFTGGGTLITLTGTGFLSGAQVTVDGSACASLSVASSTRATCKVPAHAAGTVSVAFTNPLPNDQSTAFGDYTYSLDGFTQIDHYIGALSPAGFTDGSGADGRLSAPWLVDTDGTYVYVADYGNNLIRRVDVTTGTVTTIAGTVGSSSTLDGPALSSSFYGPWALAADSANALLYVIDWDGALRRVDLIANTVATITVTGTAFVSPDNMYMDSSAGYLYVADDQAGILRLAVTPGSTTASSVVYSPTVGGGFSVLTKSGSTFYASDLSQAFYTIPVSASAPQASTPWALTGPGISQNCGMAPDSTGTYLILADCDYQTVDRITIATGNYAIEAGAITELGATDGAGTSARFANPRGITVVGNSAYVSDAQNDSLRSVNLTTFDVATNVGVPEAEEEVDGTLETARFNNPLGIASDGTYLYLSDNSGNTIRKVSIATGETTTLPATVTYSFPAAMAYAGGYLYEADAGDCIVYKISTADGTATPLVNNGCGQGDGGTGVGQVYLPYGLTWDGTHLWTVDRLSGGQIRCIDTAGTISTPAGQGLSFTKARGIYATSTTVYVADTGGNAIYSMPVGTNCSGGAVSLLAGLSGTAGEVDGVGGAARFNGPYGLTVINNSLYVSENGGYTIRKIDLATQAVSTLVGVANEADELPGLFSSAYLPIMHHMLFDPAYGLFVTTNSGLMLLH